MTGVRDAISSRSKTLHPLLLDPSELPSVHNEASHAASQRRPGPPFRSPSCELGDTRDGLPAICSLGSANRSPRWCARKAFPTCLLAVRGAYFESGQQCIAAVAPCFLQCVACIARPLKGFGGFRCGVHVCFSSGYASLGWGDEAIKPHAGPADSSCG